MEFTCFVWPLFHSFIDINATFYIDSLNDFIAIKKGASTFPGGDKIKMDE